MTGHRLVVGLALLGLTSIAFGNIPAAQGETVYSYQGHNLNPLQNDTPPDGAYTTANSVAGSFALAAPLAASLPISTILWSDLLSLSFSDGRSTITLGGNLVAGSLSTFKVGTNAAGNIDKWQIVLHTANLTTVPDSQKFQIVTQSEGDFGPQDSGHIFHCAGLLNGICSPIKLDSAFALNNPGTWSVATAQQPSPVPLPAPALLLAFALAALGFARALKRA